MFTKKKRKKKRKRKKATRLWAGFLAEGDPLPAPQRGEKEPKPAAARALGWAPIPANRPSTWNGNKNTPTYRRLVGRRHPFAGRALLLLACTRIEEKKKKTAFPPDSIRDWGALQHSNGFKPLYRPGAFEILKDALPDAPDDGDVTVLGEIPEPADHQSSFFVHLTFHIFFMMMKRALDHNQFCPV